MNPLFDELFQVCFKTPSKESQGLFAAYLKSEGHPVEVYKDYMYIPGDIPCMLVAHTDTVHFDPVSQVFHDPEKHVLWSPEGIGGDDRCGVWAILTLLRRGFRPHVLLTDLEERGCVGARSAARTMLCPDVHVMIQLDRRGQRDAVYYSNASKPTRKWVNKFGWSLAQGSFTDIAVLMPEWRISGVNLSIGYVGEHRTSEYVRLDWWQESVERVARMLNALPPTFLPYKPAYSPLPPGHPGHRSGVSPYGNRIRAWRKGDDDVYEQYYIT